MSIEYQLLNRIEQAKSRIRDIRTRAGLPPTTPILDRVTTFITQRRAAGGMGGILAGLRGPMAPPAEAVAAAPPATQYGEFVATQEEELGIEAR